jgi:hypothetical protein
MRLIRTISVVGACAAVGGFLILMSQFGLWLRDGTWPAWDVGVAFLNLNGGEHVTVNLGSPEADQVAHWFLGIQLSYLLIIVGLALTMATRRARP